MTNTPVGEPEKHGNADVGHVATDGFPRLGDDENLALRQRDLDGLLELGQTQTSSVVPRHGPLTRAAGRTVAADRHDMRRVSHTSHGDSHVHSSVLLQILLRSPGWF